MTEWIWLDSELAEAIHDEQLAEHGGGAGVRDKGALLSALARPQNLVAYGNPDAADLASAHAFGVAKNHPFIDGNKRTAWVLARLFLQLNAIDLSFDPVEAVVMMLSLAAGDLSEDQAAAWFRGRIQRS